jgi:outer membrane protein OmpA-like peptidoglycan-associated protein
MAGDAQIPKIVCLSDCPAHVFFFNCRNAAHYLLLSQQRADAVKTQLMSMDIDGTRLTTKGFGDTKRMDTNGTLESKENNRRVEFIKM